jgi:glycosyltransferase involved in cell wall biosynthesis
MFKQHKTGIRICHLTSAHAYNDERIYLKECLALTDSGYETHLVAPEAPDEARQGIYLHSVLKVKGNRLLRMTKTVWDVYQKALAIDADIYHFHDPELIPVGLALKATGKRVIYDVHEDVPRQILSKNYISERLRYPLSVVIENLENFASKRLDGIVTATPFIRDRFLQVASNVVDINNFPILNEFYLPQVNWKNKERAICYVGGISKTRGIYEMVEAMEQTDATLLLAGKFESLHEYHQVKSIVGWKNVEELGYLSREEIAQTLAKSMAGLVVLHPIANYLDSFPVKMFEYMCAGIPVIASNFPLWINIVEGNECGICVDPKDPKAIAEAIQWTIDHPDQAKRMGQNGRKAVEENYNWENEGRKLCKFYQETISNRAR